jgi:hypothetical protein
MNKTQKSAIGNLLGAMIGMTAMVYIFIQFFVIKKTPPSFMRLVPLFVPIIVVAYIYFLNKKESKSAVDCDERDEIIIKRAVTVTFIWIAVSTALLILISNLALGADSSVPVWILSLVYVAMIMLTMAVYAVAVLIQYGWGNKHGE